MRYRLIIIGVLVAMFIPLAGRAELPPELNPICWEKVACDAARAALLNKSEQATDIVKQYGSGWIPNEAPCQKLGWGKCLPAGVSETQISFGGQRKFMNIGVFIQSMYKYALVVAGIVAVVMIIIAGFQWAMSGGNSDLIGSAKKRIAGATVGLLIAYLSYAVLQTINPALVNLRLPQIWLLRGQKTVPEFCSVVPTSIFALAADEKTQKDQPAGTPDFSKSFSYATEPSKFQCGRRFFIKDAGMATCFGDYCGLEVKVEDAGKEPLKGKPSGLPGGGNVSEGEPIKQAMCLNLDEQTGKPAPYHCAEGVRIVGMITNNKLSYAGCMPGPFTSEGWQESGDDEIVDVDLTGNSTEQDLEVFCKDGKFGQFDIGGKTFSFPDHQFYYNQISEDTLNEAVAKCGGEANLKGFALKFEMNEDCDPLDEDHYVGYDGSNQAVDLGDHGFIFDEGLLPPPTLSAELKQIPDKYFIPLAKLRKGLILNMNATQITDIDEDADREVYYQRFGIVKKGAKEATSGRHE